MLLEVKSEFQILYDVKKKSIFTLTINYFRLNTFCLSHI